MSTWRVVCFPTQAKPWVHEAYRALTQHHAESVAEEYRKLGLRAEAKKNEAEPSDD